MRTTALVPLLLLFPSLASAAPATVRVFEAKVRATPHATAEQLHLFVEGTAVSVDETATNGWRRVRLPDGRTGWIEDSAIALAPAAPPQTPSVPPPPAAAPANIFSATPRAPAPPPRTPIVYIKDLDHLAQLVSSDPVVGPKASALARRATTANLLGYGLAGVGIVISFIPIVQGISGSTDTDEDPDLTLTVVGLGMATVGLLVAAIVRPGRDDLIDVVNDWNGRHTDGPIRLDRQPAVN